MRSKTIFISFLHASLSLFWLCCALCNIPELWKLKRFPLKSFDFQGEWAERRVSCEFRPSLMPLSSHALSLLAKALQRCLSHVQARAARHLRIAFLYYLFSNIFHPLFAQVFFRSRLCRVHSPALYGMLCVLSFLVRRIRFSTLNQSFKRKGEKAAPTKSRRLFIGLNALRLIGVMCVSFNCSSSLLRILPFCSKNLFTIFQLSALFRIHRKKHNSFKRVRWYCEERPPVVWWKSRASIKRRFSIDEFVENGSTLPFRSSSLFTPKKLCSSFVCCSAFWDFCFSLSVFLWRVTTIIMHRCDLLTKHDLWCHEISVEEKKVKLRVFLPSLCCCCRHFTNKQEVKQCQIDEPRITPRRKITNQKPGGERCVWSIDRIHAINDLTILCDSSEKCSLLNIDRVVQWRHT